MRDTIMRDATRATRRAPLPAPRGWWVVLVLAVLGALYAVRFVAGGEASFPAELAPSLRARRWAIFSHAVLGTLALLAGPFQFRRDLLARRRRLHRALGRVYVGAALGTGATGLVLAPFSYGGASTHLGFGLLGALVVATTWTGLARIRAGEVARHREWMLRSFALMFAGVMLRVEMPLAAGVLGMAFEPAYRWVAWLSWVPNLAWAEWHLRRSRGVVGVPAPRRAAA